MWGNWNQWGACSKKCGGGQQSRTRPKVKQASGGGSCPGAGVETQPCNTHKCEEPKCCLLGIFCGAMGKCMG